MLVLATPTVLTPSLPTAPFKKQKGDIVPDPHLVTVRSTPARHTSGPSQRTGGCPGSRTFCHCAEALPGVSGTPGRREAMPRVTQREILQVSSASASTHFFFILEEVGTRGVVAVGFALFRSAARVFLRRDPYAECVCGTRHVLSPCLPLDGVPRCLERGPLATWGWRTRFLRQHQRCSRAEAPRGERRPLRKCRCRVVGSVGHRAWTRLVLGCARTPAPQLERSPSGKWSRPSCVCVISL